ncbi:hypothetical protein [Paenarthrobacter sp. A20]|uniref:hypothetical protein n=1 Tax=Paenarthrobacter sp. A20 TaxID=2817891 RepID=UPI00209DD483|nr:hypothetical protein [Paenarthrobacter sp. A20]MCP1415653.1 hypothetical protein [Paenarthrobacter sp. A20]
MTIGPFALVTPSPSPPAIPAAQMIEAVPPWAWAMVGTLVGGLALAYLVGRFITPTAEARKVARVAADSEARAFASQLRKMASDVSLAKTYEDSARRGTSPELNAAKARELLKSLQNQYETAGKLARHPDHLERSAEQERLAPLMIGLIMKFGSEQYSDIRDARNYFSQQQPFAELGDDYLGELAKLIKFAAKVFDPGKVVPFGLSRLDNRMKLFMEPLYRVELPIVQQANLHRTALYIQQNGHVPGEPDVANQPANKAEGRERGKIVGSKIARKHVAAVYLDDVQAAIERVKPDDCKVDFPRVYAGDIVDGLSTSSTLTLVAGHGHTELGIFIQPVWNAHVSEQLARLSEILIIAPDAPTIFGVKAVRWSDEEDDQSLADALERHGLFDRLPDPA